MQNFRHLDVWARAHALARTIHQLSRTFSDATDDFKAQLTSAAESIPSNIVEGCDAATNRKLARFLDISIKSAFELDYRLELAKDYERHWDAVAEAPYLWNPQTRTFVSLDDPESLRLKAQYVRRHNLGGIMYWEHSHDPGEELLDVLAESLGVRRR